MVQDSGISSGPASGLAGDRGDDLAGGTGPKRSGGSGPNVSSSSGLVPAQREGNQTATPGHGKGPLRPVLPVNTGHAPPSPVSAHSALIKTKNWGRRPRGLHKPLLGHRIHRVARHDEVVEHPNINQRRRLLERLRQVLISPRRVGYA